MEKIFIAPNGVEVRGVVVYTSPIYRDSNSFVNKCWDEIIYAQNRLVKLVHTLKPTDDDNYEEFDAPEQIIICDYLVIPELDL
jgi:hypothetical protein